MDKVHYQKTYTPFGISTQLNVLESQINSFQIFQIFSVWKTVFNSSLWYKDSTNKSKGGFKLSLSHFFKN